MAEELAKILANGVVIRAPRRSIIMEPNRKGVRYKIYLPTTWNDLWEELRKKGKEVDVLIIIRF